LQKSNLTTNGFHPRLTTVRGWRSIKKKVIFTVVGIIGNLFLVLMVPIFFVFFMVPDTSPRGGFLSGAPTALAPRI